MIIKNDSMIEKIIVKNLIPSTDYIFGFANLHGLLTNEYHEYPYGISIGRRLDNKIVDSIENGPTLEYLNHYRDVNIELDNLSKRICTDLRQENINCINIVPTLSLKSDEFKPYLKTLRYKVSHKMIATRAGLGWIGKTDLFISKVFGARLRLVSILIDKPVNISRQSIDKSKCGKCEICVRRCPARAANGTSWDINTDRDLFFDAQKCWLKCGEFGKFMLNSDTRICGICVSVCPIGRHNKTNI